jgi:hypothetical protein
VPSAGTGLRCVHLANYMSRSLPMNSSDESLFKSQQTQVRRLALSVIGCSRLLAPLLARHLTKRSRFTEPSGTKNSQPTPVPTFQRRSVQRSFSGGQRSRGGAFPVRLQHMRGSPRSKIIWVIQDGSISSSVASTRGSCSCDLKGSSRSTM